MDLKNLENQTLYDLHSTLEDANRIIEEIVEYNKQIVNEYAITGADLIYNGLSVTGGYGPNEMLDEMCIRDRERRQGGRITA